MEHDEHPVTNVLSCMNVGAKFRTSRQTNRCIAESRKVSMLLLYSGVLVVRRHNIVLASNPKQLHQNITENKPSN